jgi:tRNA(fMet)-specific endonuclease VapC
MIQWSTTLYLLDTNMVGYIVKDQSPAARRTMRAVGGEHLVGISAIVEAEILYGLARKPEAVRLRAAMEGFLSNLEIFPWDSPAAQAHAGVRSQLATAGTNLSAIDMLIAADAIANKAILVTHDKAFLRLQPLLRTVDWATDL